jgi:hypothetical protein
VADTSPGPEDSGQAGNLFQGGAFLGVHNHWLPSTKRSCERSHY